MKPIHLCQIRSFFSFQKGLFNFDVALFDSFSGFLFTLSFPTCSVLLSAVHIIYNIMCTWSRNCFIIKEVHTLQVTRSGNESNSRWMFVYARNSLSDCTSYLKWRTARVLRYAEIRGGEKIWICKVIGVINCFMHYFLTDFKNELPIQCLYFFNCLFTAFFSLFGSCLSENKESYLRKTLVKHHSFLMFF